MCLNERLIESFERAVEPGKECKHESMGDKETFRDEPDSLIFEIIRPVGLDTVFHTECYASVYDVSGVVGCRRVSESKEPFSFHL